MNKRNEAQRIDDQATLARVDFDSLIFRYFETRIIILNAFHTKLIQKIFPRKVNLLRDLTSKMWRD